MVKVSSADSGNNGTVSAASKTIPGASTSSNPLVKTAVGAHNNVPTSTASTSTNVFGKVSTFLGGVKKFFSPGKTDRFEFA